MRGSPRICERSCIPSCQSTSTRIDLAGDAHECPIELELIPPHCSDAPDQTRAGSARSRSAPPPPPAPSPVVPQPAPVSSNTGTDTTVTGVVRSFNYGAAGEVNGVILDQGTVVYFPPEQAGQVTQLVQVGSRIRVRGWVRQGPAGNALIGAETITNRTTGNSISVADQPPPPRR